jgi:hypothetical protein
VLGAYSFARAYEYAAMADPRTVARSDARAAR